MCSQWPRVNVLYNPSRASATSLKAWILHLICSEGQREALEMGWYLRCSFWGYVAGGKERKGALQSTLVLRSGLPAQPCSAFLPFTSSLHSPKGTVSLPCKIYKMAQSSRKLESKTFGKFQSNLEAPSRSQREEGRPDSLKYSLNCLSSDWGECNRGLWEIRSEQSADEPGEEEEIDSFHFICRIKPH